MWSARHFHTLATFSNITPEAILADILESIEHGHVIQIIGYDKDYILEPSDIIFRLEQSNSSEHAIAHWQGIIVDGEPANACLPFLATTSELDASARFSQYLNNTYSITTHKDIDTWHQHVLDMIHAGIYLMDSDDNRITRTYLDKLSDRCCPHDSDQQIGIFDDPIHAWYYSGKYVDRACDVGFDAALPIIM